MNGGDFNSKVKGFIPTEEGLLTSLVLVSLKHRMGTWPVPH